MARQKQMARLNSRKINVKIFGFNVSKFHIEEALAALCFGVLLISLPFIMAALEILITGDLK